MATDPVTAMSAIPTGTMLGSEGIASPDAANDGLPLIVQIAQSTGDISHLFDPGLLGSLGLRVVEDYTRDLNDRAEWEAPAKQALERAAQEEKGEFNFPFTDASAANIPILTTAALQFYARTYPAICKMGEIVKVKVIGSDKGRQQQLQTPQGLVPVSQVNGQPVPPGTPDAQPMWAVPPGAKQKRADRVADYMNVYLQYRMEGWEKETALLLMQLPIIGCGFRKMWWSDDVQKACFVSALNLILPMEAKGVSDSPRVTEQMPNIYPFQIRKKMASGYYRKVDLAPMGDDAEQGRMLLEQHRWHDLDEDGVDEPYVITVDKESAQVLRIEANFGVDDVTIDDEGDAIAVDANSTFYIQYDFLPNPKGQAYGIGLGHLLAKIGNAINTILRQIIDAETMRIAGGGFIGSGLRLQGNGQTNTLRWQPGEYKNVNLPGAALKDAIWERTLPNASPIMFQVLDLLLGQAKDISAVKDVLTGDASNQGQVGTTMALIEQGLMVYTAIYKSIYRSAGEEFMLIYDNLGSYGGEAAAEDYLTVLDDPEADFTKDFAEKDMDIVPTADPASVTQMQKVAKAQAIGAVAKENPAMNQREATKRQLVALGAEDVDSLLAPENAPPPPNVMAAVAKTESETEKNKAAAVETMANATYLQAKTAEIGTTIGMQLGDADSADIGSGFPPVAGPSDDAMGVPGLGGPVGPAAENVAGGVMGPQ